LSKYVYAWKQTEHGRRLFRSPRGVISAATLKATADDLTEPDYGSMKKDELIEAAEAAGKDSSGTKADIIERLEADD
jgi:hypothetical protein